MIVNQCYFTRKLNTGFYKIYWMSLVNSELYFFNDRDADNYFEMHILTNSYVNKIVEPIIIEKNWKETQNKEVHYQFESRMAARKVQHGNEEQA